MSVNETLASYSNLLLYSAMAAYTGAFLSFTLDLAGGPARVRRARELAEDVRLPAQEPVATGAVSSAVGPSGLPPGALIGKDATACSRCSCAGSGRTRSPKLPARR